MKPPRLMTSSSIRMKKMNAVAKTRHPEEINLHSGRVVVDFTIENEPTTMAENSNNNNDHEEYYDTCRNLYLFFCLFLFSSLK